MAANVINLDSRRRPRARIERMPDPRRPNRTAFRITGTSEADVADQVASLVAEVEQAGTGYGRFIGPHHIGHGCYVALGEIVRLKEVT